MKKIITLFLISISIFIIIGCQTNKVKASSEDFEYSKYIPKGYTFFKEWSENGYGFVLCYPSDSSNKYVVRQKSEIINHSFRYDKLIVDHMEVVINNAVSEAGTENRGGFIETDGGAAAGVGLVYNANFSAGRVIVTDIYCINSKTLNLDLSNTSGVYYFWDKLIYVKIMYLYKINLATEKLTREICEDVRISSGIYLRLEPEIIPITTNTKC